MKIQEFTNLYYADAQAAGSLGLPAAFILAHSYLESGRGTSLLAKNENNFFGVKAIKNQPFKEYITTEILNGKRVRIKQKFRKYNTAAESFKDYSRLLSTNRYRNVLSSKTNLERARALKAAGYFTAGTDYVYTLAKVANQFEQAINKRPNSSAILPLVFIALFSGILVFSNR